MYGNTLILCLISVTGLKLSQQLLSNPDLSNTLIPLRWRQMCGYRYRPIGQRITFSKSCYRYSHEDQVIYKPHRGEGPHKVTNNRIVLSRDVKPREAPWAVSIGFVGAFTGQLSSCSGVLITMKHILTAAHCLEGTDFGVAIFVGSDNLTHPNGPLVYNFTSMIHPEYRDSDHYSEAYNDIGIISLKRPIDWRIYDSKFKNSKYLGINTICLPQTELITNEEILQDTTLYGWGWNVNDTVPDHLRRGDLKMKFIYENRLLLSEGLGTPQTCYGDSGGGIVQYLDEYETRAVLVGIASGGSEINTKQVGFICHPDTVANSTFIPIRNHLDWIYQQIGNDQLRG